MFKNLIVILFFALTPVASATNWHNCSLLTKVVGGSAGGALGAKLGGRLATRFGRGDAREKARTRTAGQLVGGLVGATAGAKTACAVADRLTSSDRTRIANVNRDSLSRRGRAKEKWKSEDGSTVDYEAKATTVEVKEYGDTTCKQVNGNVTFTGSDQNQGTAQAQELYCESDDGEWVEAEGTVL